MMMINPRTQKAVFSQIVVFHFISFIFLSEIEDMICLKHVISTDQWSLSQRLNIYILSKASLLLFHSALFFC